MSLLDLATSKHTCIQLIQELETRYFMKRGKLVFIIIHNLDAHIIFVIVVF